MFKNLVITTRHYASVVYAMVLCPFVCLSVQLLQV